LLSDSSLSADLTQEKWKSSLAGMLSANAPKMLNRLYKTLEIGMIVPQIAIIQADAVKKA
jgi:hypothetical protein